MGKSPGKWIKAVLFGKKSSKSGISKNSIVEKKAFTAPNVVSGNLAVDPVISDVPPQIIEVGPANSEFQNGTAATLPCDVVVSSPKMQGEDTNANDDEKSQLEQAAIKAQAAFRGYLARRAFGALKGIIRLQAIVRGHLVRRQGVATLRCMLAIVKFQALVRGRRVRLSDAGHKVLKKTNPGGLVIAKQVDFSRVWAENLTTNAFVSKLIASSPNALPLSLHYDLIEPNSAWNWLERWSLSRLWESVARPKKISGSKPQRKQVNMQALDTEPGRSKRGLRNVSALNGENSSLEKPKHNPSKALNHQAQLVQEHHQSELERVKRNLRKISISKEAPSDKPEAVAEKMQQHSLREEPSYPVPPDVSVQAKDNSSKDNSLKDNSLKDNSSEKMRDPTVPVSQVPVIETPPVPALADDEPANMPNDDQPAVNQTHLESGEKVEESPITKDDVNCKEDKISKDNGKARRRRSFPAKQECPENVSRTPPTVPSYMAATQSAKAKLRAQSSPSFDQDGDENGFIRRHSLPSSTSSKLSSQSPRMTTRPIPANGKGGAGGRDRSLSSSRDGWKR